MIDDGINIPIHFQSVKFNTALMGAEITSQNRWFIGYVWMRYSTSEDLTLTLKIRRGNKKDVIEDYTYTVLAAKNYFKQKTPPNLSCKEWWIEIDGEISDKFECKSFGVGYDILTTPRG